VSADPAAGKEPEPGGTDPVDVLGRRIAAGLIDVGLLLVLFFVLAFTIGDTESHSSSGSSTRTVSLTGGPFLLYLGLVLAYYFVFEAVARATPGKLLLGLRVVSYDGAPPSTGAIVLRTLLRIVDWLPLFYLVGFIMVLATGSRRRRLGDLAAKTSVARAQRRSGLRPDNGG
jgi:uncharacterized RDD family membrane protein YckC